MMTPTREGDFDSAIRNGREANSFPRRFPNEDVDLLFKPGRRLDTGSVTPRRSIVLIGFMGAGKSWVSYHLAHRTGLPRFDTDQTIGAKFGLTMQQIFEQLGQDRFREEETEALRQLSPTNRGIIVTGGGTILTEENVALLRSLGIIVLLEADEETLYKRVAGRDDRPLLQTEDPRRRFFELFRSRKAFYENAADIRIDTSNLTLEEVAETILKRIDEVECGQA